MLILSVSSMYLLVIPTTNPLLFNPSFLLKLYKLLYICTAIKIFVIKDFKPLSYYD